MILPDVSRVLACLYEKDIKFETHTASYKSLLRLQASSHAPVPFYDGPTLFLEESREICRYIAEKYEHQGYPFLLGKDALERASVEQWLHNEEHAFNPPSRALFCHLAFPLDEDDGDDIDMHTRKLEEVLEVYEQRLSDSEFLVGNKFTLADLVHLPNSHYIKASNKFLYLYDSRKNVRRWWDAISDRDSWKKVLKYMEKVDEQNKQEKIKKQQQQKEDPRTSSHSIRMDSRKQIGTEPRTILVSPADSVSSTSIVPQIKKPLPSDIFRNETLVSSSQSTRADKTSVVQSKETTIRQETPPTPVQSTPITSKKYSIPAQSTKDAASLTPAKKPAIDDAAKSSTNDASFLEPSSSKDVSNHLDVFDYYPSHTGEETPYIKPTPPKPSETLDAFSGSHIDTGHTKTSSISAKEVPVTSASDSYKSDSRATGVDSQIKDSVIYSGRTPSELEPTGSSASKPHTTDVHHRLQAEQWHTATTGLNEIKEDADRLMSTGQGKLRNDVQQYQSQDLEQATSHPVPQEPMSMELVQGRQKITQRPYTDQSRDVLSPLPQQTADAREIVEDNASSDKRGALPSPSTQEYGVTPPSKAADKDAQSTIPSRAGYPGGQDTSKHHRDPGFVSTQRPVQDARVTFDESKASDSTISNERFSYASRPSSRKDLDGARHASAPFEKRYPGTEDTSKQAKDKISTPWQMTHQDAEDTTEEPKISEPSSSRVQHLYVQRADAPSRKQETIEDPHSSTSAIQKKYANVKDTPGLSRDTAFRPMQTIGQDDQETFRESKSGDPSFLKDKQSGTWQTVSSSTEQEVNQDGHSVAPPSQTRYQSSTPPSKTSYAIAKNASKQPKKKAAQDDVYTSEESNTAEEVRSTEHPLNAWREPVSPRRQVVEDSSSANTPFKKRYPYDEEDKQVADTASASQEIAPDGGIEETKLVDSTPSSAKLMYTQQSALPPPRQAEVEDAKDKSRQSRVIIPELQKMVSRDAQITHEERKTGTPGQQSSDRLQVSPQPSPAAAKGPRSATAERIQFPEMLDTNEKSRGTFEQTKGPGSTLPRAQSLGAQDAQHTNGESIEPTDDERNDVSTQLQPDAEDQFQQSKLSDTGQKGLVSLSSQERDVKDAEARISEEKTVPVEWHREITKKNESQESFNVGKTSSVYPEKPPFAKSGEKGDGSKLKHPQASDAPYTFDEKLSTRAPAKAKGHDDFGAEEPFKKDITNDQTVAPPLLSNEPTSQVQTTESLQEAASHGGLSAKPSTIEQWQLTTVPLNDVTSSSGGDKIGMATIDQKLAPMSQQGTPSADGINRMAKEAGEQRMESPLPIEAKKSGVPSSTPSFPGASTSHLATSDEKFARQSIIDERVEEPTKIQASISDPSPAHTKRATPDDQELGDSELVSTADGQISEAPKTRHAEATLHEDVPDDNLSTNYVSKDTFKETKVAESTPHSAKPMYTQQPAPTPIHSEVEDTRDKGTKSRETIPDLQKTMERRAGTAGEQVLDYWKAIPPSRQAAADDAHGATGDTIQSQDILESSKKSRGTYEEAKGPSSTLSKAQPLGAQDAQRNTGESTTPTAGQRKDVSIKPQPYVKNGLEESKLSAVDWNGLRSLSSEGKDGLETETTITEEKSFSTGQLRETHKKSEPTTPKAHPTDSHGSVEEAKIPFIYQKKLLVAKDSQERPQTIPAGEKGDSTPKHQQASIAPNTSHEKLNASELSRAKSHGDFTVEEPYRQDTTDGQKVAPPLLNRELTSQVQPPSEPSHDAAFHGDLSGQPSTIDQWQRASVPLHDVTPSSIDDEMTISTVDQKPTPMSQQESGEQIVEPPVPLGSETSGVQPASPSFPGASVDDHAITSDKFAKQPIIDERVGEPIQMRTSNADAHPSSEPTKRETLKGHQISDLEHVDTPDSDRQISEAKKTRDDPTTVHEDVYDVNLSTHDMGKDTFKETKVADSTPSSARPMYIQQPALTPSRQKQVEEVRDKTMQSRETIPERQKMVERKTGTSGEQSPDRQKAIRPSRQRATEDAPTGDIMWSRDILDTSKESRGTFEEATGPGSTLPKAQIFNAQDSELAKGESTIPTADQRKDWKDAKDDETIMTEEKSFSTERLKDMFQESESTTSKTQPTDSQGSSMEKTSSTYKKGPLPAQDSQDETKIIPAGDKVDSSTPEHKKSSGAPYTYDEKSIASAPARADIHDDHSAGKPYKKYTSDDQKASPYLSSKEPASEVQPLSEPLQRAVPDGDLPGKSFTIDQWQRASAPLHGVITDSGDADVAMSSNNDQKSRPISQEETLSSQRVNQMGKQSGEQRIKPTVPIGAETSDVGVVHAARPLPEAARTDDAAINDKLANQSNIDERVGEPKQMQAPDTAAHPASAPTKRKTPDSHEAGDLELISTPEGQRLKPAKATQDPATVPEDVHDVRSSAHDAATYEKEARYHASGDELLRGSLRDQQARLPASTQAQPTVETPHDSDSSQYLYTGGSGKTELAKPTVIAQEAKAPIADPTSMDPHRAGILPAEVAHSEQKSTPADKGSARAALSLSVEPIKADSNVSAAHYTNVPQMISRQQARPSAPSTIGISASDTQGVIGKIQEVTPDNRHTDDSGKPFVPSQEQVSHASQVIPGQEEMVDPPSTRVPTSETQLASAEVHEATPDDQHALESITPLASSRKQGSHVGSAFESGEVGPAEKKLAPSDQELAHSAEQHGEPRKEQTVVPTTEQIKAQPTIIGRQKTPDNRKEVPPSEDVLGTTPTHGDVHPAGSIEPAIRPLSVRGEEPTSATQAPSPRVVRDSSHTEDISAELENVQSMKPSTTPDARDSRKPGGIVFTEQESSPSDPSQGDAIVAVPDQAKDSQTTPRRPDILSTQHPSRKVQENIPGDDSGKTKPSRPSSVVREGKSSKGVPASAPGIQLGEQKFAVSGQDSAYPAQPPSSAEPRSKEIGYVSPSTQLNSTTEPRNGDAIVAALDQAKDSQETPGPQFKLSTQSSYTQLPSGKPEEDKPTENLGEAKSSKPPSVVREDKPAVAVPVSAPDTQHGAAPDEVAVNEQKLAPSGQGSAHTTFLAPTPDTQHGIELDKEHADKQKFAPSAQHSVQPSFSTEPTKEDTVSTDQTNTLDKIIDQNYMTPALDKVKTPSSGTHASRETQKGTDDDKLPSQWRVSPDRHVSESPEGLSPEARSVVAGKETTPGSSKAETSNTSPDSTPTYGDAHLSSGDVPAVSSLPETQDLQGSASAQNVPTDSLGKVESPRYLSTDQVMAPTMSPTVPSVAPLSTVPGTNSVQEPRQASAASTMDLESVPDTQHGMPQGGHTPAEKKIAISDQELAHISEPPSSSEPRKEKANAAAGDQLNVPKGPETTVQHQVKASSPDAREALQKDQQPSHAVLPSDLHDGPTSEVRSAVDKGKPLLLSQEQTSAAEHKSTLATGDVPPTSSLKKQEAEHPAATKAPTSQVLQSSAFSQNDSLGNIESLRQTSTDQVMAPAINSAAPSDAQQGTEPGRSSSEPLHALFSTKTTKEDTVVTADDQAEDMQTITHQQAITPAPGTAKTAFPSTQDASRTIQEGSPDDGHIDEPLPTQEQVSLLGSSSEPREGQTADPHGTNVDENTATSPSSQANVSDSRSGLASILGDVLPSNGDRPAGIYFAEPGAQTQLPATTQDGSLDALSMAKPTGQGAKAPIGDPASSLETQPGSSQTQGEAAPAEQNFAVSDKESANTSKSVSSAEPRKEDTNATVDQMSASHTIVTRQISNSTPDTSDTLRDLGFPSNDDRIRNLVDPLIANQEEDPTVAAADQTEGMQTITHQQDISPDPGTAKTQVSGTPDASRTIQESTPDDGHIDEPLPSQEQVSLGGSYSEPREEQTADPYGTNFDEKATTSPSSQENISDSGSGLAPTLGVALPSTEGPAKIPFPEPGAQTQLPVATQDVSLDASSKAKSTGQGAKALTGDPASPLDTQPDSSQRLGEAAPAEQKFAVSDKASTDASKSLSSAELRKKETNAATADQTSVPQAIVTHQVTSSTPDGSDTLLRNHESSRDDDQVRNSVDPLIASQKEASRAERDSEGSTPEVHNSVVDKKTALPSNQAQTSSTGPDSTQISGDAHLSDSDVLATSSLKKQEAEPAAATQAPTSQVIQGSAFAHNDSFGNTESPRKISTGVPTTNFAQNQDGKPPATRAPTTQAPQGSPSLPVVPASHEKLDSPRLPSAKAPVTSPAAPSGAPQGTEPGTHSVQPSQEASFDFLSGEESPTTQGDQVSTLPNGDLSTNQVVWQSESADSKGINSQWNLKGASTDEKSRTQQIDQFGTKSFKDDNKESDGTVTAFEELQKQLSSPKGRMGSNEKTENQQQADQAIVESLEGNEKQAEQTKPHDTETIEPEDMEASENTNQKNNRRSQVETLDLSGKQGSGVQRLGENTKGAPNLTEDSPGDVQAVSKSEGGSRSSEESKLLLQSEYKNQGGETEVPSSEIEHTSGRGLPGNSYQNNSSQSQAEAPDKSVEQSSTGIQNKDNNSSGLDGSGDPSKPGYMKD